MPNKPSIVFMGTPSFATNILEGLLKNGFNVVAIFTQPDKEVGRKKILTPPHIKQFCITNNIAIPIYQPNKLRDNENVDFLKKLNPSFIIVAAYAQILSLDILQIAPCINLHASLLPKYRGASPIQQSILNNDKQTGVTSMLMNEGLDTGDILSYIVMDVDDDMFVDTLFDRLSLLATTLTINTLNNFHNISAKKQLNTLSSHTRKIKKEHGMVDCNDAYGVYLKHRAFRGWPDIFLENGLKLISIRVNDRQEQHKEKLIILEINKEYITVSCLRGSLNIYILQPPSKQKMSSIDYIKGKRIGVGDSIL